MTMTVLVGSKKDAQSIVRVEADGMTAVDVRRAAIQIARAIHHIADPVALSEHEAAVRLRQQMLKEHAPKMTRLNNGVPFHRQPAMRGDMYAS